MSFNNKTKKAAKIMFGEEHEREMDHPLKQVGLTAANAGYNAMDAVNQLKSQLDPTSARYHNNMPQGSSGMGASVALPGVPNQNANFSSGSYANPSSTTDSGANSNSSSLNYSFMEDMNEGPQSKEQDPNRNKFGFHKRNAESIQARIDKARKQGKEAKVKRLTKKLNNFQDNQARRASDGDTYTRNESVETGGKTKTTRSGQKQKGTGIGNLIKSIF